MEFVIFIVIIGVLSFIGGLANRLLYKLSPYLIILPTFVFLSLIGLSFYFAQQVEGLGQLAYVIYLLVFIPTFIIVGTHATILFIKAKRSLD